MLNEISINGKSIESFGGRILDNPLPSLIEFAPIKTPDKNEWYEEDGIEVDLQEVYLQERKFTLRFWFADYPSWRRLFDELKKSSYKTITTPYGEWRLRATTLQTEKAKNHCVVVKITFVDDFPIKGEDYVFSNHIQGIDSGMSIEGVNVADYGISILSGTDEEWFNPAKVRENLKVNQKYADGTVYFGGDVNFKSRNVQLNLLLKSDTITNLINNYYAFVSLLIRTDKIEGITGVKTIDYKGITHKFHYKSAKIKRVANREREPFFNIELTITIID